MQESFDMQILNHRKLGGHAFTNVMSLIYSYGYSKLIARGKVNGLCCC